MNEYLIPSEHSIEELQSLWIRAINENKILALIPKSNEKVQAIYKKTLENQPPPKARLVVFSSGSSGEPKAIFHSLDSLLANQKNIQKQFSDYKKILCLLPPWSMAGFIFHLNLIKDSFERVPYQKNLMHNLALCEENNHSDVVLVLNPFLLSALSTFLSTNWNGLLLSLTAPIPESMQKKYQNKYKDRFILGYGLSEAAGPVLFNGKSIGHEISLSENHELIVKSPSICLEVRTAEKILHPNGELYTGDLFKERDGQYVFVSREKDLIDIEGKKIPPYLIESILLDSGLILDGIAYEGQKGQIYFNYAPRLNCEQQALVSYAEKHLPTDHQPKLFIEVDEVEKLPNGKINRKKFRN